MTAGAVLVTTVDHQKDIFTKRNVHNAIHANKLSQSMWGPILRTLATMVDQLSLKDCNVTCDYLHNAETVYGPDVNTIKGKTVETKPKPVKLNIERILISIMGFYHHMTVSTDLMFINIICFLLSISLKMKFITIKNICSR